MDNVKITQFDFWKPVVFEKETPSTSDFADTLWRIGSFADQFASLGSQINVTPERVNVRKYSFEENHEVAVPAVQTGLKVALYVLSFFTLPLIALAIKIAFKWKLNAITMLKENNNVFLAGKEIGKTQLVLVSGDLFIETTDVIVNPANARLKAGGGVCGLFSKKAGDDIFEECEKILRVQKRKAVDTGDAVLTTAGDLAPRIKAIVHAVGPDYNTKKAKKEANEKEIEENDTDYAKEQADLLDKTYDSSLELITNPLFHKDDISPEITDAEPMRTIAFPSISTGIFDFPLDLAAKTALEKVKAFIEKNPGSLDEVRFVFLPLDKDKQKTAKFYLDALDKL